MFETAELGRKVGKKEFQKRRTVLRQDLLEAKVRMRNADFPVIVLFAGVDGAGKSETANLLSTWMDPRFVDTRAYGEPSQEETERPEYWRYWRDLPARGHMGVFLSAWYHKPLLDRVYGWTKAGRFEDAIEQILSFERSLARDGALILKFWMHLGKREQRRRLKNLKKDPLQSWRVTRQDWEHWRMYDEFILAAERLILRTSRGHAPWTLVEGTDPNWRSLEVGYVLLDALRNRLDAQGAAEVPGSAEISVVSPSASSPGGLTDKTVLTEVDLSKRLERDDYREQLDLYHGKLNRAQRRMRELKRSTILVFEGWDGAGKGGAIRRLTACLDARAFRVISIAAPSDEERAHHYLWRFWRHLPRAGQVTIYDRSWYGRVLVERVEKLASENEWRRAYSEINEFEDELARHGTVLLKFWVHIDKEEQQARFEARRDTPYKSWKLTDEDWRNRDKWDDYATAVEEMVQRTSTSAAPWVIVEGNDKRYARIKVLRTVSETLERHLEENGKKRGRKGKR